MGTYGGSGTVLLSMELRTFPFVLITKKDGDKGNEPDKHLFTEYINVLCEALGEDTDAGLCDFRAGVLKKSLSTVSFSRG